jgi:hypothetical protein
MISFYPTVSYVSKVTNQSGQGAWRKNPSRVIDLRVLVWIYEADSFSISDLEADRNRTYAAVPL